MGGYPRLQMVGGGYPHPRSGWGYPLLRLNGGTPQPGLDGYPLVRRQITIVSTCYVVGDVPLAFMQEDFLVGKFVSNIRFSYY